MQYDIFVQAKTLIDEGRVEKAYEFISNQTMMAAKQGSSIIGGDGEKPKAGLKLAIYPEAGGKYQVVETCQFCGDHDSQFKDAYRYG